MKKVLVTLMSCALALGLSSCCGGGCGTKKPRVKKERSCGSSKSSCGSKKSMKHANKKTMKNGKTVAGDAKDAANNTAKDAKSKMGY